MDPKSVFVMAAAGETDAVLAQLGRIGTRVHPLDLIKLIKIGLRRGDSRLVNAVHAVDPELLESTIGKYGTISDIHKYGVTAAHVVGGAIRKGNVGLLEDVLPVARDAIINWCEKHPTAIRPNVVQFLHGHDMLTQALVNEMSKYWIDGAPDAIVECGWKVPLQSLWHMLLMYEDGCADYVVWYCKNGPVPPELDGITAENIHRRLLKPYKHTVNHFKNSSEDEILGLIGAVDMSALLAPAVYAAYQRKSMRLVTGLIDAGVSAGDIVGVGLYPDAANWITYEPLCAELKRVAEYHYDDLEDFRELCGRVGCDAAAKHRLSAKYDGVFMDLGRWDLVRQRL